MRALALNPLHSDLTMKYADMLGSDHQRDAAISVLEHLAIRPEAPFVVNQWLGYYLRDIPARVDDSISRSKKFLALFPEDSATRFNLAYAYGAKYCYEKKNGSKTPEHADKERSLEFLETALTGEPKFTTKIEGWTKHEDLKCVAADFKKIIEKVTEKESASAS